MGGKRRMSRRTGGLTDLTGGLSVYDLASFHSPPLTLNPSFPHDTSSPPLLSLVHSLAPSHILLYVMPNRGKHFSSPCGKPKARINNI